jgi:hypothetical protein
LLTLPPIPKIQMRPNHWEQIEGFNTFIRSLEGVSHYSPNRGVNQIQWLTETLNFSSFSPSSLAYSLLFLLQSIDTWSPENMSHTSTAVRIILLQHSKYDLHFGEISGSYSRQHEDVLSSGMLCCVVPWNMTIRDAYCLHHQGSKHPWSVSWFLLDYTVQYHRRRSSHDFKALLQWICVQLQMNLKRHHCNESIWKRVCSHETSHMNKHYIVTA